MDYEEIFNMSYWRVFGTAVGENPFAETMYGQFLGHPEIAAKFAQSNPSKPMEMLRLSVTLAASYYFHRKPEHLLAKFAVMHSRSRLGIEPHLYRHWLDSVLQAVKTHDPACDENVLEAWRRILTPAIEFMQSKYDT
jgi:hemoglobin-like flavoprotein